MTTKKRLNARSLKKRPWHELKQSEKDYLWKKQVARCDAIFSQYIRLRDRYCITCGTTEGIQCSHYYTKKAHAAVRWDERNAHSQCAACHVRHHNIDPGLYTTWLIDTMGRDEYDLLRLKAYSTASYTYDDLREIEVHYAGRVEAMR
ncbi:MAG: hypothetical protein C0436_00250 [Alphaproteobacteria bacterium]|nr:hypothetical protein [Alphaproteobacteria bacterium]